MGVFCGQCDREVKVRRRSKPKIEWICEEEIAEAMKLVLTSQGAITPEALIKEAAKLFGYKSITQRINPLLIFPERDFPISC